MKQNALHIVCGANFEFAPILRRIYKMNENNIA